MYVGTDLSVWLVLSNTGILLATSRFQALGQCGRAKKRASGKKDLALSPQFSGGFLRIFLDPLSPPFWSLEQATLQLTGLTLTSQFWQMVNVVVNKP